MHAAKREGFKVLPEDIKVDTRLVHPKSRGMKDNYDATAAPLYQTATFGQPDAVENGEYDYTRSGNPTRCASSLSSSSLSLSLSLSRIFVLPSLFLSLIQSTFINTSD